MIRIHNRRWYFLKKSVELFPRSAPGAARPFAAADGLQKHYQRIWDAAGPLRRGWFVLQRLAFLAWLPRRTRTLAAKHGLGEAERSDLYALARRRWFDPRDLIVNEIRDDAGCDRIIRRFEEAAVIRRLNPQYFDGACEMDDKIAFADRCRRHGLPHPELRAVCRNGEVEVRGMPATDSVFVKPAHGTGGFGAAIVDVRGADTPEELKTLLEREAGTGVDWLAQDRLRNHPTVEEFALSALSTMRIVTIRDEHGAAETVAAALKIAVVAGAIVDNAAADGFRIAIDLETGRLGRGAAKAGSRQEGANPVNGVVFEGRRLPYVAEAVALARRAHDVAFADYVYAGWDVAILEDGPILIEGNAKATMTSAQRPNLMAMAPERFQSLIAFHLENAATPQK